MDADKRHQLKQNELAEALARLRNFNDPRFIYGIVALVAIGLGVLAWYGWQYSRRHALEQGWQRLSLASAGLASNDTNRVTAAQEDLRSMIADTKHAGLAGYARLELAASRIAQAFRQPAQRPAAFEDAASLLEQIRATPESPRTLQAAATFALASTYESLRRFDKAKELYKILTDEPQYQAFAYKTLAEDRLSSLDTLLKPVTFEPGTPPQPTTQATNAPIRLEPTSQPTLQVPIQLTPTDSPLETAAPPAPTTPAEQPPEQPPPAPEPGNNPTP